MHVHFKPRLLHTHMHLHEHYIFCRATLTESAWAGSSSVIHGVLTNTVVICHCVSPVSRRHLGGYSVCCVINGQDAVSCTKMSLCMKQRKRKEKVEREREREREACCKCAHSFIRQHGLAIFKLSH